MKTESMILLEKISAALEKTAGIHRRQAMLGERQGAKAIQTAKAEAYDHAASVIKGWPIPVADAGDQACMLVAELVAIIPLRDVVEASRTGATLIAYYRDVIARANKR